MLKLITALFNVDLIKETISFPLFMISFAQSGFINFVKCEEFL